MGILGSNLFEEQYLPLGMDEGEVFPLQTVPGDVPLTFEWKTIKEIDLNFDDMYYIRAIERYFRMIDVISQNSSCARAKIGCVLLNENFEEIAIGHNTKPGTSENKSCDTIGCVPSVSCRLTLHAEVVALDKAHRANKIPHSIVCSAAPCLDCMKLLIVAGVKQVFYLTARPQPDYDRAAMSYLTINSGVKFFRYENTNSGKNQVVEV